MTSEPIQAGVPELTLGWRLRMALEGAGISQQEMAAYLGVTRQTLTTWQHDRISPKHAMIRLWALRTGVPLEWLETGQAPGSLPTPAAATSTIGGDLLPRLDSNQQPSDYTYAQVTDLRTYRSERESA